MRLRNILLTGFLLPFLGLAGCAEPEVERPEEQAQAYFDVPAFINEQIGQLNQRQPDLTKTVWLGQQKPDVITFTPESWQHELEYFQQIDLNKKALIGAFTVSEEVMPEGRRTIYTLKPDEDGTLKRVEVYSGTGQQQPRRLRALLQTSNALFFSREHREYQLNPQGRFQEYRISGVQKVIFFDSLRYATTGKLVP